jgi:ribosomal protein S18 acetylase RimI-like enzyme
MDVALWWDAERLVGFIGLYAFGSSTVELAGMVDPARRRRGVATALLDAAFPVCHDRGCAQVLLVVPRPSTAGRSLALRRGAVLAHSEHALDLLGPPVPGTTDPRVGLRTATPADAPAISGLLATAFGSPPPDVIEWLASGPDRTLVVELEGHVVGTVRLTLDEETGGVYGFAVDPAWQGRGIGGDVLRRVCRQLRHEGAQRVHLEVAVDNDRALGLYTSIGFTQVSTEDYYALSLR